jgi:hypothetical protein
MSKERKQEVKTIVDSYSQRQVEMYQNQFEYLVQSTNDMKRHLKISESFIDHIGKFRSTAAALVKTIVDELHLPEQERTLKPVAS